MLALLALAGHPGVAFGEEPPAASDDVPTDEAAAAGFPDSASSLGAPSQPHDPAPPAAEMTAPAAPLEAPAAAAPDAVDVTVRHRSEADRLRRSAEAVNVLETKEARRMTADLGEVLARTSGVAVQRTGGLGSEARFSLNGLTGDQVRFFVDGVPLELAGFPFGIANVPVNLVGRIEIFRGVVPIRFGADALGGAVNLVSDESFARRRAVASIQAGSFGTYRLTAGAQALHEPSGWFTRAGLYFDRADNDYPMHATVADERGRPQRVRVHRFHDGYRALGGHVETGVVDRSWADRLLLRLFIGDYDKELQNNLSGTRVFGDATRDELVAGASLRYERALRSVSLAALVGYTWDEIAFRDVGTCFYDWFGRCLGQLAQPGEILGRAQDQRFWTHGAYARLNADWELTEGHHLRVSLSPTLTSRSAEDRGLPDGSLDPKDVRQDLYTVVSGVEYGASLLAGRLENVLFGKDYLQVIRSEKLVTATGLRTPLDRTEHRGGVGDSLRFVVSDAVYLKASYEWATRLPRVDEVFGNAFPVQPNPELKPELSQNVNLELDATSPATAFGVLHGNANGFLRHVDRLIVLVPGRQTSTYQNVATARSLGVEARLDWASPGRWLELAGNATYVDLRNVSTEGGFAKQRGDRIPNRPWLFANGSAKLSAHALFAQRDELSLLWSTRYVHGFLLNWQGLGDPSAKLRVGAQVVHALGLVYVTKRGARQLTFTGEVQNLTDAEVYDVYGVPRPGRAFYFKTTASL